MDKACIAANEFIKEFIWWKLHIANGVFVNDNGEDVFEVEKPKKWVVRRKYTDDYGNYWYIRITTSNGIKRAVYFSHMEKATKFDTREEAKSWANAHQEVVQVEVDE